MSSLDEDFIGFLFADVQNLSQQLQDHLQQRQKPMLKQHHHRAIQVIKKIF
jgi:hypothetical protein